MHRRTFLHSLCVLAAGLAASRVPVRAPSLLTVDIITRESLRILREHLTFTSTIGRSYDLFAPDGARVGQLISLGV